MVGRKNLKDISRYTLETEAAKDYVNNDDAAAERNEEKLI